MAVDRHLMARLKKLLLARDVDLVVQGVEFVTALGEQDVWETLLAGVTYSRDRPAEPRRSATTSPGFVPNRLFTGTGPAQVYLDLALVLLVAHSPFEELKAQVEALRLRSSTGGYRDPRLPRLPLDGLEHYPNLKALDIELPAEMESIALLGRLPSLETLRIYGHGKFPDLDGLGSSTTLKTLEITAPLESTRGIAGAPVESVRIISRMLRDLEGMGQTPVRVLDVREAQGLDPSSLRTAAQLSQLSLHGCTDVAVGGLAGCPVRTLELWGTVSGALPTLPRLEILSASKLSRSEVQPALTRLTLISSQEFPRASVAFPALSALSMRYCSGPSLDFLRDSKLETLSMEECTFEETSALGTLARLRTLALQRVRFRALDHLPPQKVACVDTDGQPCDTLNLSSTPLRSVRGLGQLENVQILDLSDCVELETLEGLEGTDVRVLDLRNCAALDNVEALGQMPELRLVALRGTKFHANNVPEPAAGAVDLGRIIHHRLALTRSRPTAPPPRSKASIPVPQAQRAAWEELQPLLAVVDRAGLDRLVDWLTAHGTEEMFNALLKGVSTTEREFTIRGKLVEIDRELRNLAVQRIVGVGKGKEAERLAKARKRWRASGVLHTRHGRVWGPVDLRGLEKFQEIERLEIDDSDHFVGIEALSALPRLSSLIVSGRAPLDALGPLPALVELIATNTLTTRLDFVRHAPQLKELLVHGSELVDLSGLAQHPALTTLNFTHLSKVTDLSALQTLPELTYAHLGVCPPLPSLKALTRLELLTLSPKGWTDATCLADLPATELQLTLTTSMLLKGLAELPRLKRLTLWANAPSDLRWLPRKLEKLELHAQHLDPRTLPEMELESLVLSEATDLSFVSRLRGLRKLELAGSYSTPIPDLSPLHQATALEELNLQPTQKTSVEPLRGHPSLKKLIVAGWRGHYLEIPDDMRAMVAQG